MSWPMNLRGKGGIAAVVFFLATAAILGCMLLERMESPARADSTVTTVEITDNVLVPLAVRFGINLGDDAYYSGAALVKKRVQENFEGTSYRQCHFGPLQDERGVATWFRDWGDWDKKLLQRARFTILSGRARGTTGNIKAVSTKKVEHKGKMEEFRYFAFDREVPPGEPNTGVLIEAFRPTDGQFRPRDGYWTSKLNEISIGDVPPGSFGTAAAMLGGSSQAAHLRFATHYQRFGQTNGRWQLRFWAKAKSGKPRLKVLCDPPNYGNAKEVELLPQWREYEMTLTADNVPEPKSPDDNSMLFFRFEVTGGRMLLDDVEIWMEGDKNPTAFRDDCVDVLKQLNPGILRRLQMGGSTVANTIAPILRSHTYSSRNDAKVGPYEIHNKDTYSLHEMYELCELLDCEPWFCLPGTLSRGEMARFMEYLGAPAEVGYGRVRAELGHRRPWTETLRRIHVEFGNEAWNNAPPYQCGGFNGPDYWKGLIAVGKGSPHYRENVVFHAGGQASNTWLNRALLEHFPNADRFTLAPYVLHDFSKAQAEAMDTDDKLFRWVFAYPIRRSEDKKGSMREVYEAAQEAGIELSVYEINHHVTGGDGPLEPRNKIVTSIGGGINVVNTMLLLLKEHHARDQCLFSLAQLQFKAGKIGDVRLWGSVLCMRPGRRRRRPTFLACAAANRVIGGNLVETRHHGADPAFSATGVFEDREAPQTIDSLPEIRSYAFADGSRRGLILINLGTKRTHPVAVKFDGNVSPGGAQSWLLTAERITDNNEYEAGKPQVELRHQRIESFTSGKQLPLPPFSMRVLQWNVAPSGEAIIARESPQSAP